MSVRDAELKVLEAANKRFEGFLKERHYKSEKAVLADMVSATPATALIRAVAEWRIAARSEAERL